jgi:hypothetical protein
MCTGLHLMDRLFLMKLDFTRQNSEKRSNTKFYEYQDRGSRVVPCGRTDRQTEITKFFVAFRNFSNAPEKSLLSPQNLFIALVCFSGQAACMFLNSN